MNRTILARLLLSASLVFPCAAQGRAAPIVYASSTGATHLAGGDENSYGYGSAPTQSNGPVIDLRGSQNTRSTAPPAAPQTASEQGAQPDWLQRERVGPPYQANGRWYVPTPQPGYSETGVASWYGPGFHGQATATGETYDQEAMTAAHPTLPIPSLVQVTNLQNGREVILRVTDRGPFVNDRIIDVSHRAAEVLGFNQSGTARVHVRYLGPAPRRVMADGGDAPPTATQPAPQAAASAPPPPPPVSTQLAGEPVSLLPPPQSEELEGAPVAPPAAQTVNWTPPAPMPLTAGYMVQVGAYSTQANALRVRDAVSSAGAASVEPRMTNGRELYHVRLGPFATHEEADAARAALARLGYADAMMAAR